MSGCTDMITGILKTRQNRMLEYPCSVLSVMEALLQTWEQNKECSAVTNSLVLGVSHKTLSRHCNPRKGRLRVLWRRKGIKVGGQYQPHLFHLLMNCVFKRWNTRLFYTVQSSPYRTSLHWRTQKFSFCFSWPFLDDLYGGVSGVTQPQNFIPLCSVLMWQKIICLCFILNFSQKH